MIFRIAATILHSVLIQIFLITFLSISHAETCSNNWSFPSFHSLKTPEMQTVWTAFANQEHHLSLTTGGTVADIYYLRGTLLVKGLADSELQYDSIWMLPMTQGMSAVLLASAFPNGPCSLTQKTSFTAFSAKGEISPISPGVLAYAYIDGGPAAPSGTKGVRHEGTMKFTPPAAEPPADADIRGYKLVRRSQPHPVVGSPDLPVTTLGELRRWLAAKKADSGNK